MATVKIEESNFPNRKVSYSALAGALSAILVWVLKTYAKQEIPGEIASALTTILTAVVAYLVPLKTEA